MSSDNGVQSTVELRERLFTIAKSLYQTQDFELISDAFELASEAHVAQIRKSGIPYISHPIEVAIILADLKLDAVTVVAGLLHDTIEDTSVTYEQLNGRFGSEVAALVDGVTKLSKLPFRNHHENQAENFRKMLLAMAKDLRIILIKLADRLHNMRTLQHMAEHKQKQIAQETLDIYAPLAHRLGIGVVKSELEDLCLRYLHPNVYYDLAEKVAQTRKERLAYNDEILDLIRKAMSGYQIECQVTGRPKHFYSIFRKMESRQVAFEHIQDLIAFRIITRDIKSCYEALGVAHSLWKPVPGRFKDYIAIPKPNFYQSLHTTVIGPKALRIEIQIRTDEMHRIAEEGIAAHWAYKENKSAKNKDQMRFTWLKRLVEMQSDVKNPTEFMHSLKVDLFADDVYVFTPRGEVKELPRDATPVDFAYSIHTEIGNRCVGAKINDRIVPLNHSLQNGDIVDILTSETQHPNKDWLKFVVTSKARNKIRQIIRTEQREKAISFGKELFDKETKRHSLPIKRLIKDGVIDQMLEDLHQKSMEELYISLGYGKLHMSSVLKRLMPDEGELSILEAKEQAILNLQPSKPSKKKDRSPVVVRGADDLLVRFAKCCGPIYGEPIVGFITRGRGITVHTFDCQKILELDEARKIEVAWDEDDQQARDVRIKIVTQNWPGLLAQMASVISASGGNISQAHAQVTKDKRAVNTFEIGINNTAHLNTLIANLEKIKGVLTVERCKT